MELKLTKLNEKASDPKSDRNIVDLIVSDMATEVGRDGRLILVYRTGLSISMPDGFIGIIAPSHVAPIYSLDDASGLQIIEPGFTGEIVGRYKVNTTSIPSIFENGDVFARLIIIKLEDVSISVLENESSENDQGR